MQAEIITKMKTFYITKCKAYPHEIKASKRLIGRRRMPLASSEEIRAVLRKKRITKSKRNTIGHDREEIQTKLTHSDFH